MIRPEVLLTPTQLPAAVATQLTIPANTKAIIKKLTLANPSDTTAYVVTLHIVPNNGATPPAAGTAADANMLLNERAIAPRETLEITEAENHVLNPADTIQAFADVASKISMRISGYYQT